MTDEHYDEMQRFEREAAANGCNLIAGVDEAGRGPLAGPVTAACVVYKSDGHYTKADDSKKLSEKKREQLYDEILQTAIAYGVGMSDNREIDEINILNATKEAMKRAVSAAVAMLRDKGMGEPDIILVDHLQIPDIIYKQKPITHGDALSVSIASASIIAKVTRDRLMKEYAARYPEYGFDKHKGYGTKAHYDALAQFGACDIHRTTFLRKLNL